ncbi:S41 family peptidase [Treponema parvum]|uniref:S41 family peptidase n=1 Tax=Treponema parvum TaxID=138851 RepID=UPI001AEBD6F6|nr:S41 family peptidase [Treponema parvum]QTQ15516.1 S41 family peptidase [Treponema parvum]
MNNKILRRFAGAVYFVFLLLISSQCFTQSALASASEISDPTDEYLRRIRNALKFVDQNYVDEIDPKILYEGAIKGMMSALEDPYSIYLDSNSVRELADTTVGKFGGVGLSITKIVSNSPEKPAYVEVVSPIENTPGSKAGIHAGDLITAIDGLSTVDMTMNEVLLHLRGKVGDPVEVSFLRGKNMNFTKTLIRELIEVPTVKYAMINSLGYLKLIEFTPETAKRVEEGLNEFKKNDFKGLIIDLRNNPGGLITSAVDVADKFIDSGVIVSTKSRVPYDTYEYTASRLKTSMPKDIPIVVLINKGSASASEILAGALKDYHLAYLVGQNTYGKGSVQQVIQLGYVDGCKVTVARYYTPSDTNIDKIGIPPDREVLHPELTEEEEKNFSEMMKENVVAKYVESHPDMSEKDIASYADVLYKKYPFDVRTMRRIIRMEVYRTKGMPSYDLDYDIQLNEAIGILEKENFRELMRSSKTLKELQEAASEKGIAQNTGE